MNNIKITLESQTPKIIEIFEFNVIKDLSYKKFDYRLKTIIKIFMQLRKMEGGKDEPMAKDS